MLGKRCARSRAWARECEAGSPASTECIWSLEHSDPACSVANAGIPPKYDDKYYAKNYKIEII